MIVAFFETDAGAALIALEILVASALPPAGFVIVSCPDFAFGSSFGFSWAPTVKAAMIRKPIANAVAFRIVLPPRGVKSGSWSPTGRPVARVASSQAGALASASIDSRWPGARAIVGRAEDAMDRTLIANTSILDGSGGMPFPGDMKDGRLHKTPVS
jgi:hypothetical protein